eukprot:3911651-Prymnesium_polylepis.2
MLPQLWSALAPAAPPARRPSMMAIPSRTVRVASGRWPLAASASAARGEARGLRGRTERIAQLGALGLRRRSEWRRREGCGEARVQLRVRWAEGQRFLQERHIMRWLTERRQRDEDVRHVGQQGQRRVVQRLRLVQLAEALLDRAEVVVRISGARQQLEARAVRLGSLREPARQRLKQRAQRIQAVAVARGHAERHTQSRLSLGFAPLDCHQPLTKPHVARGRGRRERHRLALERQSLSGAQDRQS